MEQKTIDEEIEKLLNEKEDYELYDDVSEFSETQSVMSMQTIREREGYIAPDADLDEYLESLLKNKNKRMLK